MGAGVAAAAASSSLQLPALLAHSHGLFFSSATLLLLPPLFLLVFPLSLSHSLSPSLSFPLSLSQGCIALKGSQVNELTANPEEPGRHLFEIVSGVCVCVCVCASTHTHTHTETTATNHMGNIQPKKR